MKKVINTERIPIKMWLDDIEDAPMYIPDLQDVVPNRNLTADIPLDLYVYLVCMLHLTHARPPRTLPADPGD